MPFPFLARFPDKEACLSHLETMRWPHGVVCPRCGAIDQAGRLARFPYRQCRECRHQFTALHGTPLEGTHLPLRTWFAAIYMLATTPEGVSGVQLARDVDVTYKTAWFLGHRVRRMMANEADAPSLRGVIEVDEMYLGGKRRAKGGKSGRDSDDDQPKGRGGSRKSMVAVAVERGGRAVAKAGRTHSEMTLARFVLGTVSRDAILATDSLPAYRWIGRKQRANVTVNHTPGEYVRDDPLAAAKAHVNTAGSFNALIKRKWMGVHHWWSVKHSDHYLAETAFRWNVRSLDARLAALFSATTGRLRFREIIG